MKYTVKTGFNGLKENEELILVDLLDAHYFFIYMFEREDGSMLSIPDVMVESNLRKEDGCIC